MRLTAVRAGGVAGMVVTTTLDAARLAEADVAHLRALVDGCSFADRPPTGRADGRRVEVSVADAGGERRVRFDEHDPPAGADALLAWVDEHPAGRRTVGR